MLRKNQIIADHSMLLSNTISDVHKSNYTLQNTLIYHKISELYQLQATFLQVEKIGKSFLVTIWLLIESGQELIESEGRPSVSIGSWSGLGTYLHSIELLTDYIMENCLSFLHRKHATQRHVSRYNAYLHLIPYLSSPSC